MAESADSLGGGVLGDVVAAFHALADVDPSSVTEAQRDEAVVELQRVRSLVESVAAPWTQVWVQSRSWSSDGSRSPRARLTRDAHCAPVAAGRAVGWPRSWR